MVYSFYPLPYLSLILYEVTPVLYPVQVFSDLILKVGLIFVLNFRVKNN